MIPARFSESKMMMMLMFQFRANIRIYSDIRIFVSEYLIFKYEYWKFDCSNIFIFIFDQKLCFVEGEYTNIFGYSNICLRILDIRIQILEIWLFEFIHIRFDQKLSLVKGEYTNIFGYSNICLWILDIRIRISEIDFLNIFIFVFGQKIHIFPTLDHNGV